jgi:hypothetical protein
MPQRRFALLAVLLASLACAATASANTVEVTTNLDNPGPGCTLRDALDAQALGNGINDCDLVIADQPDTVTFAPSLSGDTITLTGGSLYVDDDVDVIGPGMDQLSVDGNRMSRVFLVASGRSASISGLTVTGGFPDAAGGDAVGGGILNQGNLALSDVRVAGNEAEIIRARDAFAVGGGIYNEGQLELDNSIVVANTATASDTDPGGAFGYAIARGAGIASVGGARLTMTDSTIADNVATANDDSDGTALASGGLDAYEDFEAEHSTFSGNTASANQEGSGVAVASGGISALGGNSLIELSTVAANLATPTGDGLNTAAGGVLVGGVVSNGTLRIESSTIALNGPATGSADGANLNVHSGSAATVSNTIISNPRGGLNCAPFGDITSDGSNFLYPDGPCYEPQEDTDQNSDPLLATGGLADNGGPTATIALQPFSPAIDAGSAAGVIGAPEDQRGLARPADFPGYNNWVGSDGSDVGAFEVQLQCASQFTPSDTCPTGDPPLEDGPTGQRAAALKKCRKKFRGAASAKKRKQCLKRAKHLSV